MFLLVNGSRIICLEDIKEVMLSTGNAIIKYKTIKEADRVFAKIIKVLKAVKI